MATLNMRQRAFCNYYVAGGMKNGTKAAMQAGYAESSAAVYASRLLHRADVAAYIELIRRQNSLVAGGNGAGGQPPDYDIYSPGDKEAPEPQITDDQLLTRQYLISTGLRNLAMCMGDRDVPVTRIARYETTDHDGNRTEHFDVQTKWVRDRNASAANQALAFLDGQLEKLPKGANPLGAEGAEREWLVGLMREKANEIAELVPSKLNGKQKEKVDASPQSSNGHSPT